LSDDYLYAIGFFTLVLAVITSWIALARKKVTAHNLAAGALLVWFLATIAAAILVPESSYLGIWVLLPGSLALLLASAVQSSKYSWILTGMGYLVSAILATFLWIPVMKSAFLGPGFTMLWMMLGVAALWMVALLPALDWITSQKRWPLPIAATLVTLGILIAGNILVGRNSPPPLVNSIGYWLDAESSQAYWVAFIGGTRTDARYTVRNQVAFPVNLDERQARILENPVRLSYTNLSPDAPPFSVLTDEAPLLTQAGPHLDVISDKWVNNYRVVKIRFTTALHDRLYIFVPNAPLLAITVSNIERTELAGVQGVQLRFDGTPAEGMEISFDFSTAGPIQLRLVEEKTGLPSFPGLSTQPEPGTMRSPGEFFQGDATDFTAIYRRIDLPATGGE
jgi:hypothetical protein